MDTKIKAQLHQKCLEFVEEKIINAQHAIEMAREALDEEEKNTTGDTFEAGRAMMQLEVEKFSKQLQQAIRLKQALKTIKSSGVSPKVSLGSLVITKTKNFYISIPAGKIEIANKEYFAISPSSPIAAEFIGKYTGDDVNFNGQSYTISEIL